MPAVNDVGKPCAGEPHARIDGRELETEPRSTMATEKNDLTGNRAVSERLRDLLSIKATAPVPDPPRSRLCVPKTSSMQSSRMPILTDDSTVPTHYWGAWRSKWGQACSHDQDHLRPDVGAPRRGNGGQLSTTGCPL